MASDKTFVPSYHSVRKYVVTPTDTLKQRCPELRHHQDYHCNSNLADDFIRRLCLDFILLPHFGDSGLPYRDGRTPLSLAAINEHEAVVRQLFDKGATRYTMERCG